MLAHGVCNGGLIMTSQHSVLSRSVSCGALVAVALVAGTTGTAEAEITRIQITRVESPAFGGASFGSVGTYDKLVGRAYGEVDPKDAQNAVIQDIELAPRNARGMVEYSMDVYLLTPHDAARGNGTILYDVVNRGNKNMLSVFNMGSAGGNEPTSAGDGFLQREGYTLVWSGWQGDVVAGDGRLTMTVPVAHQRDGGVITGQVRGEYIVSAPTSTQNLSSGANSGMNTASYETVSLDTRRAVLTHRVKESDPRVEIPSSRWAFADCTSAAFPGTPSTTQLCLQDGFSPNEIYELVYTAKNPTVLGLGFAATRDLMSFLRHARCDRAGTSNPLAGAIHTVLSHGTSQSGRYLRTFVLLGFNRDEHDRVVFDGMNPHVATAAIPLNVRFGQPGRSYGQHEDHLYPAPQVPAGAASEDRGYDRHDDDRDDRDDRDDEFDGFGGHDDRHGSFGRHAGPYDVILAACRRTHSCPKIINTVSSTEYWQARMSLNTTDAEGRRDLELPPEVRVFHFASTQHVPTSAPAKGICQQLSNPNPNQHGMRALLVALRAWATWGTEPPTSRIPSLADQTLVDPAQRSTGFPTLAGVRYAGLVDGLAPVDYGARFDALHMSGLVQEPPQVCTRNAYRVLVPRVDSDGNEVDGLRSVALQAPLGTYTGWNLRAAGFSENELCGNTGSFVPFARTRAERLANHDPRLSLEERYHDHDGYVAVVRAAAQRLVAAHLLLATDANLIVAQAQLSDVL